ncbi:MAG: DUF4389 domain-containing protein [Geminicoccaceae bacterium]
MPIDKQLCGRWRTMADDVQSTSMTDNLSQRNTWLRLVYMLVLAVAWVVTEVIFIAVVVLQFLAKLFTGHPSNTLLFLEAVWLTISRKSCGSRPS